jgi:hypothetical protein
MWGYDAHQTLDYAIAGIVVVGCAEGDDVGEPRILEWLVAVQLIDHCIVIVVRSS